MKIAIVGTRGIPNRYGGFEQCAEYLAEGLVKRGHQVTVYSSSIHPYKEATWKGVNIVHCNNPEDKLGTAGLFIYDLNCILHTRKQQYDVILMLGYTSSSVWGWLYPKSKSIVTTNMDGLEWKRTKFSKPIQTFLKFAEYLGVRFSDHLVADSVGIQQHIKRRYNRDAVYIPYGSHVFKNADEQSIVPYNIQPYNYDMLIARLEPENSIEIILDGVTRAKVKRDFLVIGRHDTKYGKLLKKKYLEYSNIRFLGAIYDIDILNNLRFFSNLYFHGHTVGGTNPSLLEAMGSCALICAHENVFNKSILKEDAFYFTCSEDVSNFLNSTNRQKDLLKNKIFLNIEKIRKYYNWDRIIEQYESHFKNIKNMQPENASPNKVESVGTHDAAINFKKLFV